MEREEKVLKALANKKRLSILEMLKSSSHGISVKEIAKKIKLSQPSTSKHLSKLEVVNLIKKNRKGMYIISYVPIQIWKILGLIKDMFYRKRK